MLRFRQVRSGQPSHPLSSSFDPVCFIELREKNGRPYLVMELVDGEPIDRFCSSRGLGVRERVAVVAEVCNAVRHAHERLVVYRDLKPSNLLVTRKGA